MKATKSTNVLKTNVMKFFWHPLIYRNTANFTIQIYPKKSKQIPWKIPNIVLIVIKVLLKIDIIWCISKKFTMTGSSNFLSQNGQGLSPKSNGKGSTVKKIQSID